MQITSLSTRLCFPIAIWRRAVAWRPDRSRTFMNTWTPLVVAFSAGFAMGVTLYGLRLRAQLHLYRRFIEDRLSSINVSNLPVVPISGPPSCGTEAAFSSVCIASRSPKTVWRESEKVSRSDPAVGVGPWSGTTGLDIPYHQMVNPAIVSCKSSGIGGNPGPSERTVRSLSDKPVIRQCGLTLVTSDRNRGCTCKFVGKQ